MQISSWHEMKPILETLYLQIFNIRLLFYFCSEGQALCSKSNYIVIDVQTKLQAEAMLEHT